MRKVLCMLSLVALLGTTAAMADTAVQFYTPNGELLVGVDVEVVLVDQNGNPLSRRLLDASDGNYMVDFAPAAGGMTVISVYDGTTGYGSFKLAVPVEGAPETWPIEVQGGGGNDDCAGAIGVAVGSVTAGSTAGATIDGSEACIIESGFGAGGPGAITAPGVWYSVEGNGNQLVASTCDADSAGSSTYDTKITVYCQDCSAQQCVTANDDSDSACGTAFASTASWCSQVGATYSILVHGFGTSAGAFELAVEDGGACTSTPVDCAPPEPEDPTGACCSCLNAPFNCTITTAAECEALTGNLAGVAGTGYQGDDSGCVVGGDAFTASSSPNVFIASGAGITDSIAVVTDIAIADVDVGIVATHTWVGDLVASLTHDDTTTSVTLIDRPGVPAISACGCASDNYDIILDDDGDGGPIEDLCGAVVTPTSPPAYTPEGALSAFNGESSAGSWTLAMIDGEPTFDDGTLNTWSLSFAGGGDPACSVVTGVGTGGGTGGGGDDEDEDEDSDAGNLEAETENNNQGSGSIHFGSEDTAGGSSHTADAETENNNQGSGSIHFGSEDTAGGSSHTADTDTEDVTPSTSERTKGQRSGHRSLRR